MKNKKSEKPKLPRSFTVAYRDDLTRKIVIRCADTGDLTTFTFEQLTELLLAEKI